MLIHSLGPRPLRAISLLLLSAATGAVACNDRRPITQLRDALAECAELESECKDPADELGEPYRTCYDTGASRVKNACLNRYDDCIDACRAANRTLGSGGAAGATGEAGAGGTAASGGTAGNDDEAGAGGT